jgi:KipI family sensor histidine kinase inhibitor
VRSALPDPIAKTSLRFLPTGRGSLLVELEDLDETLGLFDAMARHPVRGVREMIPAARTLLVAFDPHSLSEDALIKVLGSRIGTGRSAAAGPLVEVPVVYDGEDLAEVARMLGLGVEEVVRRHEAGDYVVAFTGFAPGFAYLSGGDPCLNVPRRTSPRTQVPAGAVGLAGEFSGIYPKTSPGGWQLIGRTPLAMFDIGRQPASLLRPGHRVRFRSVGAAKAYEVAAPAKTAPVEAAPRTDAAPASLEVLGVGLPVFFQDLGRSGVADQGIGRSGAADRASFRAANRLVGNPPETAVLEIALGTFGFRMRGHGVMGLAGAPVPIVVAGADGTRIEAGVDTPLALDDGDVVSLGFPAAGMRSYLAMRGGFAVTPVLGSASADTLAQIGPAALRPGDIVPILPRKAGAAVSLSERPVFALPKTGEIVILDVAMGPRTDWFTDEAVREFLGRTWTVTPQSNRIGIRLDGMPLARRITAELPSEATVEGAIQVPASGLPVLFLVDHPLTGGYPVIAGVAGHHLDRAAQIPTGARIRFHAIRAFEPRILRRTTS